MAPSSVLTSPTGFADAAAGRMMAAHSPLSAVAGVSAVVAEVACGAAVLAALPGEAWPAYAFTWERSRDLSILVAWNRLVYVGTRISVIRIGGLVMYSSCSFI